MTSHDLTRPQLLRLYELGEIGLSESQRQLRHSIADFLAVNGSCGLWWLGAESIVENIEADGQEPTEALLNEASLHVPEVIIDLDLSRNPVGTVATALRRRADELASLAFRLESEREAFEADDEAL